MGQGRTKTPPVYVTSQGTQASWGVMGHMETETPQFKAGHPNTLGGRMGFDEAHRDQDPPVSVTSWGT